jgi:hypothetical protein
MFSNPTVLTLYAQARRDDDLRPRRSNPLRRLRRRERSAPATTPGRPAPRTAPALEPR